MGIEFAAGSSGQRTQTEKFIQFLTSRPGIDPQLSVTPHNAENPHEAYDQQNDDVDDPLLDLLRNHESFSEEMFVEALRSQRGAEFVRD
jgi:hypothetical protein